MPMFGTKPVIILGHGCHSARSLLPELMNLGIPILTTWQGIDLVDNFSPVYYGRIGIYGQRCANKIVYNADQVIAIGARLSIWTIGYGEWCPNAKLVIYDCDPREMERFPNAEKIVKEAREAVAELASHDVPEIYAWREQCDSWRKEFPWLEPYHVNNHTINSYDFAASLECHMHPDEIVVTDAGAACVAPFQVMHFKPPQRLMTSGGLGEMGCAVPAAIGAAIASGRRVLCFVGDGAMMLNLQELETIAHRNLPIKIFVFANDGYAMIRGTQRNNLDGRYTAVNEESGVSVPHFGRIADAFKIRSDTVWKPEHMEIVWRNMEQDGPYLAEIMLDPDQIYGPKLQPVKNADGTIGNACFERMSP